MAEIDDWLEAFCKIPSDLPDHATVSRDDRLTRSAESTASNRPAITSAA
jgi:hypothetical protein